MTLIPLNRRNFVQSHVEVRPSIDYVTASTFFNNFSELELDEPGKSGEVRAIGTYSPRLKEINPYYFSDHPNNTNIKDARARFEQARDGEFFKAQRTESYLEQVHKLDVLCKNTWKFGIDRVQQRYMPFDINLHKKQTIKNNLYNDYRFLKVNNKNENVSWSFSNYNCLNFFTVGKGNELQTGFSDDVIHTNAVIYPNINNQYDFREVDYTVSLWINPRYKQPIGKNKNNSCIINIQDFINIYQIKGTQKDLDDREETFRLGISLGTKTRDNFDSTGFDFSSDANQKNTFYSITKDCLKYNNWHNVVVKISKDNTDTTNAILKVSIYVDKVLTSTFDFDQQEFYFNTNSFISIGNRVDITSNVDIDNKVNTLFTIDQNTDSPGSLKFISAGNERVLPNAPYVNITELFTSSRDTSEALEAEIHDIRIYKNSLGENKIKEIYEKGINDATKEEDLIFYVPCFFVPENLNKKTYINAAELKENRVADTSFNFVTNPYYFNNCGGHQVATELFLLEWVRKSRPNIIFGNRINNDYKDSLVESLTLTYDFTNSKSSYQNSKLGQSYHEMYLSQSLTSNEPSIQTGSYIYNNHLIMPCDNGLQTQYFEIIKNSFDSGIVTASYMYEDLDNVYDYSKVFLNNSFTYDINDEFYPLAVSLNDTANTLNPDDLNTIMGKDLNRIELSDNKVIQFPHKDMLFNVSNANYQDFDNIGNNTLPAKNRYDLDSFGYNNESYFFIEHRDSNPVFRDYSDAKIELRGNLFKDFDIIIQKQLPLYKVTQDPGEYHSVIFSISNQMYNRKIREKTFSIKDYDLFGTANTINVNLKESGRGMLYRADSLTKHAEWNYIGHIFYSEGFCTVLHPSLYNFGKTNFRAKFESENAIFVNEVNIPLEAGLLNKSHNKSYDPEIKASESAQELDQKFVYISEVNLHDESLNIVARAKLAQPVVKRETDNMVFRLKMDY